MRRDELIHDVSQELLRTKDPQLRLILTHQFNALTKMVAIRVKTKTEADTMLEVFKQGFYNFSYPFGPYLTWIEIPIGKDCISYVVMPSDVEWPHWQVYLNPDVGVAKAGFLWSPDGRIGPHRDRPGGQAIGPTVYAHQDGERCADCDAFRDKADGITIERLVSVDPRVPPKLASEISNLACILHMGDDLSQCPYHEEFWDTTLLPISIIMYIALAPTRELDVSWKPKQRLGRGLNKTTERGHYVLTPIKKVYITRRVERYKQGTTRNIEIPSFVRGHRRRGHKRYLSWKAEYTDVKQSWVNPHWRGTPWEEMPPHYSLAWGDDERIQSAKKLLEDK